MKSVLEARVKAQPENAEAWRELAQTKMMLGDIDGAENDCIECLRLEPANAPGLVLMGNLLTSFKKDDAAAERYYARAVEADPQSATAHANYGTLLFKRGENLKALGELRRSVQLDSRQSVARYMLAQCRWTTGIRPGWSLTKRYGLARSDLRTLTTSTSSAKDC